MSQETLALMKTLNQNSIEARLAVQCAPVLAHLKVSNLLIAEKKDLCKLQAILKHSTFKYHLVYEDESLIYILIYDEEALCMYLNDNRIQAFLESLGYECKELEQVLSTFSKRFKETREHATDFPHEIGFLLGYPVKDVFSFIETKGADSKYVGYWKVYHDVEESLRLFDLFDYVEEVAIHLVYHHQDILTLSNMQFAA